MSTRSCRKYIIKRNTHRGSSLRTGFGDIGASTFETKLPANPALSSFWFLRDAIEQDLEIQFIAIYKFCYNLLQSYSTRICREIPTQSPGRIQNVDPPWGFIYAIGELESRIGGSTLWILPRVWVWVLEPKPPKKKGFSAALGTAKWHLAGSEAPLAQGGSKK